MPALAFEYPTDIRDVIEGIEAFIRREVFPRHQKHGELLGNSWLKYSATGVFSEAAYDLISEVRMASADAGFYAMCAPESIGGGGMGRLAYFAAWERILRVCGQNNWLGHHMVSHWAKGPSPIIERLTPKARDEMLPKIMSGEHTMCFGLSEPGAGSDAQMITTRAVPDGEGWRLTGGKSWTTNSPHAEYMVVFAVTDQEGARARRGGISAFLLPMKSPGVKLDKIIKMWGSAGGDEAVSHFDDVRLEPHQLIGELNKGFSTALMGVGLGRIYNSARAIGLSRWGLEQAFEYTKVRKTFGQPISEYQGVTFPLAESAMQIHAAHLMAINVAQLMDRGRRAVKELAMTKAYCVEAGARALDRVMQTFGALGMTNEMGFTEAYTTLRKINIADGTNEILRRTIVKEMLGGDVEL
jgi:acyl-CoA dehydrogenase